VFSRRVVGWSMQGHLRTELVLAAVEMAVGNRQPEAGLIHHSDHGSQYTSVRFGERCAAAGIRPRVGTVGDCFDNAMVESFFASLECELLAQHRFRTHDQARTAVFPVAGSLLRAIRSAETGVSEPGDGWQGNDP
jgi:putative transposase